MVISAGGISLNTQSNRDISCPLPDSAGYEVWTGYLNMGPPRESWETVNPLNKLNNNAGYNGSQSEYGPFGDYDLFFPPLRNQKLENGWYYLTRDPDITILEQAQELKYGQPGVSVSDAVQRLENQGALVIPAGRVVHKMMVENDGHPVTGTLNGAPNSEASGMILISLQDLSHVKKGDITLYPGQMYDSTSGTNGEGTLATNNSINIPINSSYYNQTTPPLPPYDKKDQQGTVNDGVLCQLSCFNNSQALAGQIGGGYYWNFRPNQYPSPVQLFYNEEYFYDAAHSPPGVGDIVHPDSGRIKVTLLCLRVSGNIDVQP